MPPRADILTGPVLAFDTSGPDCAVAVTEGGAVRARRLETLGRGHAERLLPLAAAALAEAGLDWQDLAALGVGVGPGNFTGIRIAVAAARGLALSLGRPAVGVSGFDAATRGLARPCLAVLPGRGGLVYAQRFPHEGPPEAPATIAAADLADLADRAGGTGRVVAEGAAKEAALAQGLRPEPPLHPRAIAIARLTAARAGADPARPRPLYLRAPNAARTA